MAKQALSWNESQGVPHAFFWSRYPRDLSSCGIAQQSSPCGHWEREVVLRDEPGTLASLKGKEWNYWWEPVRQCPSGALSWVVMPRASRQGAASLLQLPHFSKFFIRQEGNWPWFCAYRVCVLHRCHYPHSKLRKLRLTEVSCVATKGQSKDLGQDLRYSVPQVWPWMIVLWGVSLGLISAEVSSDFRP